MAAPTLATITRRLRIPARAWRWTNRYNGPGNGSDFANAMAVDSSGNVLVTGQSYGGTNTDYDYATIKYSAAGVALWTNRYNGPGNYFDSALDMAADSSGNAVVTGISSGRRLRDDQVFQRRGRAVDQPLQRAWERR